MTELELKLDGVTFESCSTRVISGATNFSYTDAILMSMLGTIIWTGLWMYLDNVIPSEFGVPRPLTQRINTLLTAAMVVGFLALFAATLIASPMSTAKVRR